MMIVFGMVINPRDGLVIVSGMKNALHSSFMHILSIRVTQLKSECGEEVVNKGKQQGG